jgi:hypothetical protein
MRYGRRSKDQATPFSASPFPMSDYELPDLAAKLQASNPE